MPSTVHVIARMRAKAGKEEALKQALSMLVAPSRRELSCFQYDLLQGIADSASFCFVERWDSEQGIDNHAASEHVKRATEQIADLVDAPPSIERFRIV
jgi:quinol monooxygenase YgiN